ncbi:undecaprenyl-diphosphatase [Nakamurella sp. UYEF19]|uniref:phosphatase PAP2 family protein n=1 Tax=Nakamurella sp. UYEF19 TaxID=1756392 RepID=UPI003394F895
MQKSEQQAAPRIRVCRFWAAATWLVIVLAVSISEALSAVRSGRSILGADPAVLHFMVGHRTDTLTVLAKVASTVASPVGLVITLLLVLVLHVRRTRKFDQVIVALVVLIGVNLINTVIKMWVARPRPDLADRVPGVSAQGLSFPSGHTIQSAAIYGVIAVVLWRTFRQIRPWVAGLVAALLTIVVGLSRLYLGVHWFTDVLAGWIFGASWLALVLAAESMVRQRRSNRAGPSG